MTILFDGRPLVRGHIFRSLVGNGNTAKVNELETNNRITPW